MVREAAQHIAYGIGGIVRWRGTDDPHFDEAVTVLALGIEEMADAFLEFLSVRMEYKPQ